MSFYVDGAKAAKHGWIITTNEHKGITFSNGKTYYVVTAERKVSYLSVISFGLATFFSGGLLLLNSRFQKWENEIESGKIIADICCETLRGSRFQDQNSIFYALKFKKNLAEGRGSIMDGTIFYPDGRRYEGEFQNGKPNGTGAMIEVNGDTYYGNFVDGVESDSD